MGAGATRTREYVASPSAGDTCTRPTRWWAGRGLSSRPPLTASLRLLTGVVEVLAGPLIPFGATPRAGKVSGEVMKRLGNLSKVRGILTKTRSMVTFLSFLQS